MLIIFVLARHFRVTFAERNVGFFPRHCFQFREITRGVLHEEEVRLCWFLHHSELSEF